MILKNASLSTSYRAVGLIDRQGYPPPQAARRQTRSCAACRWVAEGILAWVARFRRLARDKERLPATLAGLQLVAFDIRMIALYVELARLLALGNNTL